jgi:CRP-like cAMP-binding protein
MSTTPSDDPQASRSIVQTRPPAIVRRDHFPTTAPDDIIRATKERMVDVSQLKQLALFDGLSPDELALVAKHAIALDVPAGKEVVHDGAESWDFFVITEGTADVRHGSETAATLKPGDHFGEIGSFAPDRRRTAAVVSTSQLRAIVLSAHQLRSLAEQIPELGKRLRDSIDERLGADSSRNDIAK